MVEGHFDFLPIEIARPVKEMRLQQFLGRVEAGADAKVGRAVEAGAVSQLRGDGIDPVMRAQVIAERQVGRGKADRPPNLVTMLDHTADREGAGEQAGRGLAIAGLQRLANAAGGDDLAIEHDGADRARGQAQLGPSGLEQFDAAAPALAEGEVLTGHHARRTQPFDQQLGHEILGRGRCQFGVEGEDQHGIRPGRREQFLPLVQLGQAERRGIGLEEAHRVRIEGRDDRRAALGLGPGNRLARHGLVAQVEAIEIAQRDNRTAQGIGHGVSGKKARDRHCGRVVSFKGMIPARITRRALPPITARISSGVKPSSSSAWVTWTSPLVSNRTVVAPS